MKVVWSEYCGQCGVSNKVDICISCTDENPKDYWQKANGRHDKPLPWCRFKETHHVFVRAPLNFKEYLDSASEQLHVIGNALELVHRELQERYMNKIILETIGDCAKKAKNLEKELLSGLEIQEKEENGK